MNILDILIAAILGFGLLSGMHKGMITSLLATIGFGVSWFGAKAVYAKVATYALSNSTLMAVLNQYLEPEEFFQSHSEAIQEVSTVIRGNEEAITNAVNALGDRFAFLKTAFSNNLRMESFKGLGLTTLSEYLNQTLWEAVFNVLAFILCFILIYVVITIIVNLLDKVISFPVLRGFDWLLGGVFGLLRSAVVVLLVVNVLPMAANALSPEVSEKLMSGSKLVTFFQNIDLVGIQNWISQLLM